MSKSLQIIDDNEIPGSRKLSYCLLTNKNKRILKSKENIFKPKCNKELKKKLKKYKLRRDGIEDPDILNVSKILVSSLRIKSPNNQEKVYRNNTVIETEQLNSGITGNYLIRMVRKKKASDNIEPLCNIKNNDNEVNQTVLSVLGDEVGEKKHMDAFKLMMDARNKSIGCNSPGKEKLDEPDEIESTEKKENKAKRILSLQKMALAKGSIKNKEIEEFRDRHIKKKMIKRAERFKDMITKVDCKDSRTNDAASEKQSLPLNGSGDSLNKSSKNKSFKLCDIFDETTEINNHREQSKRVAKEDIEFLKKLSPSLKKKENMLSYFTKISKDDCEDAESNYSDENNKPVIKVKFNPRRKKKLKLLQSSEGLHTPPETIETVTICKSNKSPVNHYKRCKRKRNLNVEKCVSPSFLESNNIVKVTSNENRPKRNIKKPIKYTDDIQIFSSDEELHIFTPKKKKNIGKPLKLQVVEEQVKNIKENKDDKNKLKTKDVVLKLSSNKESNNKIKDSKKLNLGHKKNCLSSKSSLKSNLDKKSVKLAPIFVAKMQLSPADIEAKQNFLKSGVPEKLKKKVQQSTNIITSEEFPSVVHVQQYKCDMSLLQGKDWFSIPENGVLDPFKGLHKINLFKTLLSFEKTNQTFIQMVNKIKPENILKSIKHAYPKFPVYRTYHLLSGKSKGEFKDCIYPDLDNSVEIINGCVDINNENPEQLNWCDKYKPTSSKQIIGNFESIKELRRWLETWTENLEKARQIASDESDFSDFYHSDTDSRYTMKNINNVLILTGQTGSGKTSSVYAVASELAIKVIEVNASSKRTGKIMLQDLQEATQSHKVNRGGGKSGGESSQKFQEEIIPTNIKKRGRPKKAHDGKHIKGRNLKYTPQESCETTHIQISASQESVRSVISLILIDDADIVFEQDDGFCSAVSQLIQSSKRPVILITSSLSCPHLQRFLQVGKVLHMQPFLPRMLGTWLDIMCLADAGNCYTGLGAKVLDFYRGDIRKAINYLQFYINSNKHVKQGDEGAMTQVCYNIDDENSTMSWGDCESLEVPITNDIETELHIERHMQILYTECSSDIFNIWWNLQIHYKDNNVNTEGDMNIEKEEDTAKINEIAQILDIMSMIDSFECNDTDRSTNITTRPWYVPQSCSLFENENLDCYHKSSCVVKDISNVLMKSTIAAAQKVFKQQNRLNLQHPNMTIIRKRDKLVSRHNRLSSYLHPSAVLDRRAIALDYWPACRTLCRTEKSKTDSNVKRNNRFCHYLKSLNVLCKNDFFDSLADSLS